MAGADAKCAELHGGERLKPEAVVVNDNGTLRNVFVWVTKGAEGWSFPPPEGEAVLNQKGCMYEPHVQGMRVGQSLAVKTLDPTAQTLQVNATFSGLTSNDTMAHIHCCAPPGTNAAGVIEGS